MYSTNLPTLRVLPVEVETIKAVLLEERDCVLDEFGAGGRIVYELRVFVASGIVPSTQG